MGSPFPGMDPYLEGEMWQEFHETLANSIRGQLMPQLSPKYVALLAKRYVLDRSALGILGEPSERVIYPDVHVTATERTAEEQASGSATAVAEPGIEIASPLPEEVPLLTVEIRDVAERLLVTVIEILSPVNKQGEGARDYEQRRTELLRTRTHLLEIDLLRQGTRIRLMRLPPPAPYYVYLSRVERRPLTRVWPLELREPLPTVAVPLLAPDPDVSLDLQAAVNACFDLVGYERLLDYTVPPPAPALSDGDQAWAEELVQAAS